MNGTRGMFFGLMGAAALLLSGCGEVAYKTGAGADALRSDTDSCKQAGGGPDAYKSCMSAKGWAIADLDAGPSSTYIPPKPAEAAAPVSGSIPAAPLAPAAPMAPVGMPAPPPTEPMTPVPVTAWIKFGGGDPKDSIAACVATLGPAHAPDKTHKTVTVALLSCMRDRGWRGI